MNSPLIHKERLYEHLIVWKESHALCLAAYKLLDKFPDSQRYALCEQIRKAAYSVPMNIVEGNHRHFMKEKLHFLSYSQASLEELDYQMLLAKDLSYITPDDFSHFRNMIGKVSYLLNRFRKGIRR